MMADNLHAFLRSRRSVRHFKQEPVPIDMIRRLLETTTYAPSAHNLQPWRFAVLTSVESKVRLAETIATRFRQDMRTDGVSEADIQARVERTVRRTRQAPVAIVLCRDTNKVEPQPDVHLQDLEEQMGKQSVALAGLQLLLAAHAEGLSGTWICWPLFAPEETRQALGLAENWEPEGMIFLGFPTEIPQAPERIQSEETILWV
jgi:coenzyme F420-0:L-glutamate ligase / coenzyme F420-1:gamma-L-glutamate ligase